MRSGSADGRVRRYRRARAGIPTNGCPETLPERSRRRSERRISPTNYQSACSINPDRINVTFLPENVTQSLKNATFIHKAKHSKAKHNEKPSSKVSLEKGAGRMPAPSEGGHLRSFSRSRISVSNSSSLLGAGGAAGFSFFRLSLESRRTKRKTEKAMMRKSNVTWRKLP